MCKGSNTTSTSTAPNPQAMAAYQDVLNRAQGVAQTPYQAYSGELVAPVNAQQTAGIGNINQNAGFAQPYIQQAGTLATQASQPLTQQQIQQYQSPYTQSVVDATSAWFNNQNQQQQQNVLGNAAAQGALGGDRVGVAQANLAAQQTASQAPVIAGLYNQGYQQAVGVAQQQQQNQANAAYSLGNLGVAGQNAALSGATAQVGAGSLQQGTQQAQDAALLQQFQTQQAFPYQQTQWLAGIDTGVGSNLGGTSQTTGPAPNPLAQYGGLGLAAAGLLLKRGGAIKGFAPGGTVQGDVPYGGAGWIPSRQITMGRGAPGAPNIPGVGAAPVDMTKAGLAFATKAMGSNRDTGNGPSLSWENFAPSGMGSYADIGMSPAMSGLGAIYAAGGPVRGFAPGGAPMAEARAILADKLRERAEFYASPDYGIREKDQRESTERSYQSGDYDAGGNYRPWRKGFAPGGLVDDGAMTMADRWAPALEAIKSGEFDPQGSNYSYRYEEPFRTADAVPVPRPRPDSAPQRAATEEAAPISGFAPQDGVSRPRQPLADILPGENAPVPEPLAYNDTAAPTAGFAPSFAGDPTAATPSPQQERRGFGLGVLPNDLKMPLLAAGLGMLASRSPFLGNAIGEGGLTGIGAYTQQKQADLAHQEKQQTFTQQNRRIDLDAKRLDQAADQARKHLELEQQKFGETKTQHALAAMKPEVIGMTPQGLEIKGVRDPQSGGYRIIDPASGRLLPPGEGMPTGAKPAFVDPKTGKPIATDASAEGVIPSNAQLVASGTPYDYSTDGPYVEKGMDVPKPAPTAGKSTGAIQTDGELFVQTGKLPPVAKGRNPAAIQMNNYRNAVQNYGTALAQSRGLTPEQTADMWRTAPGALRFVLGADGRSTVALGTAVRHLDTVQQLAKAWAANDTQAINRVRAIISREFGSEAATNLDSAARIVGPEIIKALGVAGAGTEHDRNTASNMFSAISSPKQLLGAAQTVQALLGGQLDGRRRQALSAGLTEEKFKNLIGDRPYEILSHAEKGAPATGAPTLSAQDKQALDWAKSNPNDPRASDIKKRLGVP